MTDLILSSESLREYRAETYRWKPGKRLTSREQAVEYVNQRGFIFFWPNKGFEFPSLWSAVAGDRPIPDNHDDPGHVTWDWKDSLLGKRRWYYARVLRKRNTMISLEAAPYFYALSENYGDPDEDYLILYEQGRLTLEAKLVYEALLHGGLLDTIALRRAAHLTSAESDARFNKALTDLQVDFKILPVGVVDAGTWHYAFAYDIAARHMPDLPEKARTISEKNARLKLAELYVNSVGAIQASHLSRLFGWPSAISEKTVQHLVDSGLAISGVTIENQKGIWLAHPSLV